MPLVRPASRAAEGRARNEQAFLAAAEELVAGGARFADLAVAQIATAAGFSRASFYVHFTDKRAVAVALGQRFAAELEDHVGDWLRGEDPSPLAEVLGRVLAAFTARRGAVLLLAEAAAYDEHLAGFWRGLHERFEARVGDRLRAGRAADDLASVEAQAFVLVRMTQATIVEHLATGRPSGDDLVAALTTLWRAALGTA